MDREQPSQDQSFFGIQVVKTVEGQSSGTQGNRLSEVKFRIEELHKEQEAAHNRSDIFDEARIISEINDLLPNNASWNKTLPVKKRLHRLMLRTPLLRRSTSPNEVRC